MATNPQLKRAGAVDEYTPEMIAELIKCKNDPVHFIRNYVKIQHQSKGAILFDLFPYQEDMIRHFDDNTFSCVMASRQMGKCLQNDNIISTIIKPKGLKRGFLYLIDRATYRNIFNA